MNTEELRIQNAPYPSSQTSSYLQDCFATTLIQFERTIKTYVRFSLFFFALIFAEVFLFVLFFPFLIQSSIIAISLAVIVLTIFAYLILRLYLYTQKNEQLTEIRDQFLQSCKKTLKYKEGQPEYHMALAGACSKLAATLQGKEYHYYSMLAWLEPVFPWMDKFSCWWHWYDLHKMKELLLQASVSEHIKLVKGEPTSLELHAALANAYVMLSGLYVDPRKIEGNEDDRWIPHRDYETVLKRKFRATAERAIEEFKILNAYAPHDPWVHAQLAYSYHDLQMPEEEMKEYETILKLCPDDKETLFKLGVLYFQQGLNAQGLKVYEELKSDHYQKAEILIQHYGRKG